MKLTVHLEGKNRDELVKGLQAHLALLSGGTAAPTKKGKSKDAEDEEELKLDEQETEEESSEEETESEESEEADEEEGPSVDDVKMALKKYASKYDGKKAMALLKKYAAHVDKVPATKRAALIAATRK